MDTQLNQKISVSLIIACFERAEELRRLLASLKRIDFPETWEIIIVDDGSKNPLPLKTVANEFACSLVRLDKNQGPSEARNTGVQNAKGEFLWFLDSDTEVENPRVLKAMVQHLRQNESLAGTGGEAVKINGNTYSVYQEPLLNWLPLTKYIPLNKPFQIHPRYISTNNLLIFKKDFLSAGGFSPLFDMAEDQDLCLRLAKFKKSFLVQNDTCVVHYHSAGGRDGSKFWFFNNTWNYLYNMNEARVKILFFHFPYRLPLLPLLDIVFTPVVFLFQLFFAKRRGDNLLKEKSKGRSQNFLSFILMNLAAMCVAWLLAAKFSVKLFSRKK